MELDKIETKKCKCSYCGKMLQVVELPKTVWPNRACKKCVVKLLKPSRTINEFTLKDIIV